MVQLQQRLFHASGKVQALVLVILGALASTAFPPIHMIILLFPAFVALFWLVDAAVTFKGAFRVGWLFGVGHFASGFYWVGHAFLVDAARYGWMAPFAVLGLAMGLALFAGLVAVVSKYVFKKMQVGVYGRTVILAVVWISVEWVRGWVLTGFPWNQIGSVWANFDIMMQFASVGGVLGLGLVTLIAALLPAGLAYTKEPESRKYLPIVGFALLICVAGFGAVRLSGVKTDVVNAVKLRLVQPNIPQHLKWKPDLRLGHMRSLIKLSAQRFEGIPPPTHIIWPETAVPYNLQHDFNLLNALGKTAPIGGALITGAPRSSGPKAIKPEYWNSLLAILPGGKIDAIYDKIHLVPFGEYVPWRSVLKFTKLTEGRSDFSMGQLPRTLKVTGLPAFAPLICYEAIFANEVGTLGIQPRWLLNITNDAWFGQSSAPYQHLAAVRFRSIEMGLPLARVANTGISAMIDPYGRILAQLALDSEGVLDVDLPKALKSQTLYGRFGDAIVALMMIVCVGFAAVGRGHKTAK